MESLDLPEVLHAFARVAVRELRHVYDVNASRFDPHVGDDAMVFGVSIYRNSWYGMERVAEDLEGWTSSRPEGSLVICGSGVRIHVYRHGHDENVDLDSFRLDQQVSETKRLIAAANAEQLSLDLDESMVTPLGDTDRRDLSELVIVHAGNPADGCCGIWIGAPVPADEVRLSPWHWIEPLWVFERTTVESTTSEKSEQPRHDELPEPDIQVEPIDGPGAGEQSG